MALEWVEGMITKIIDETSNTKRFYFEIPALESAPPPEPQTVSSSYMIVDNLSPQNFQQHSSEHDRPERDSGNGKPIK